jgi:serpin B
MAQALHFSTNPAQVGPVFGALQSQIMDLQRQSGIELTLANGLWAQKDFHFLPDFLANATSNYQAVVNQADFVTQSESVRGAINQWVGGQTKGRIVNLLGPRTVTERTRLVLVNAIYFKGEWVTKFAPKETTVEPFHVSSNQTVNASFMNQTLSVRYYENDAFQAVELPYKGTNVAMVVLLPKNTNELSHLEAALTPDGLGQAFANMSSESVIVSLPKFKFELTADLIPKLENLGMTNAFSPLLADFSGMDGTNDLFINAVVHKAMVDVDESGTVAAAATAVGVSTSAISITPVFIADHPFIFMIRDTRSGSILFLGRLVVPTVSSNSASIAKFKPASFGGIFYDTNGISFQSSGSWTCSRSVSGKFTGQVSLAGKTYRFSGQLYPQATSSTVTIHRAHLSDLAFTLQFPDAGGPATGIISAGNWTATIVGTQTTGTAYSAAHSAPQAGSYTLTLAGASDGSTSPGYGSFGNVTVAPNGKITLSGRLSDGSPISQASTLTADGVWPLYVPLYAGKGSLLGSITFTNLSASRLSGTASWIKTGAYGHYYVAGFTNVVTVLGSVLKH